MARVKVAHFCTQSLAFRRILHMFYGRQFSCLFLTFHLAPSQDIEILQGVPWHADLPVKGKCCSRWLRMPSDSKVPCQWSWPFLSTGEHLSNDPSTNPSDIAVKAAMHGPFQQKYPHNVAAQRYESPRCPLLFVLHCVLVCCHANINKDITCCGTTSHSRATAASAVEKSWPRATALLAMDLMYLAKSWYIVVYRQPWITVRQFKLRRFIVNASGIIEPKHMTSTNSRGHQVSGFGLGCGSGCEN